MWVITGLSREILFLNMWVDVEDGIEDKAPHNYWDTSGGSPSSRGGSSNWGNNWSSHQPTMTRAYREGNGAGWAGRGLRVKVNLPIIKDEKTKDAVTYHLWQWDVVILHQLDWNNPNLMLYIFWSLQGFLGDLARSLGWDTTLTNILQMLDEHYEVVMMFNTLGKELYSLKQGSRRMWLNLGCTCHSRSR